MYDQIIEDFKENKIKKESIAYWTVKAFYLKKEELDEKCSFISTYILALNKIKEEIISASNSIITRNVIKYIFEKNRYVKYQSKKDIQKDIGERLIKIIIYTENEKINLEWFFSQKFKGKKIVCMYEPDERFNEIRYKIKDTKFISVSKEGDYSYKEINKALHNSDIAIINSIGISEDMDVIADKGTEDFAIIANYLEVPLYCISSPFAILKRNQKKLYQNIDKIESTLFRGVISSQGIKKPSDHLLDAEEFSFLE